MNIKELENKIKEIFDVNTEVHFHPQQQWCLHVITKKDYLFSEQMDELTKLSNKYNLNIHVSNNGIIFKKIRLYITEKPLHKE